MRRGLVVVAALVAACSQPVEESTTRQTVGANGATVQSTDGSASVTIPAGALAQDATITVQASENVPAASAAQPVGAGATFGPEGQQFAQPVTVTLTFDPSRLPAGKTAADVVVFTAPHGSSRFVSLGRSGGDATHVSAQTTHFSDFVPAIVVQDQDGGPATTAGSSGDTGTSAGSSTATNSDGTTVAASSTGGDGSSSASTGSTGGASDTGAASSDGSSSGGSDGSGTAGSSTGGSGTTGGGTTGCSGNGASSGATGGGNFSCQVETIACAGDELVSCNNGTCTCSLDGTQTATVTVTNDADQCTSARAPCGFAD